MIPAYNENESIVSVINEVRLLDLPVDLLVVDDGSTDDTFERARSAGVAVVRLPFNLGYGAAVQTGMIHAVAMGYDVCVLLDGDGQHDPKYIPDLVGAVISQKADLALGSRFIGDAQYVIPLSRRLGMAFFSRVVSHWTGRKITDPTSGFQAIGQRLAQFFADGNYPHDFPDADTLMKAHFAGFNILEVPVTVRPRLFGQSMHGGGGLLYYAYKMLLSIMIVLTQRGTLRKGGVYAVDNPNRAQLGESVDTGGDDSTGKARSA